MLHTTPEHRAKINWGGTKRTVSTKGGLLVKSNPSGDTMNWGKVTFGVPCCTNAFSPKSTCDLAFCPDCFNTRTNELTKDDNLKERRLSGRNRGESAAKASKGETGGGVGATPLKT